MAKATFAAGCFWGVEARFREVPGVADVCVGYTGGVTDNPTYREVCTGRTGHAEAVDIDYDSDVVSFEQLLDVFWALHDPTTLNRQGPDVGTQYRSAVYYHDPEQAAAVRESAARLDASRRLLGPVVTEIVEAGAFHRAEEDHQRFFEKRGMLRRMASHAAG